MPTADRVVWHLSIGGLELRCLLADGSACFVVQARVHRTRSAEWVRFLDGLDAGHLLADVIRTEAATHVLDDRVAEIARLMKQSGGTDA